MPLTKKKSYNHESLSSHELTRGLMDHRCQITAYVRMIVRDMHIAEDIFQEITVIALSYSERFDSIEGAVRWAMRVGKNKAIDYVRASKSQVQLFSPELLDQIAIDWSLRQSSLSSSDTDAVHEQLEKCISSLTPRSRNLLELRYSDGKKPSSIAKSTGQNVETIYKAISRSLLSLRKCMERSGSPSRKSKSY